MKKIIIIGILTLLLFGCKSDDNNIYNVELNNEPYEVCGEDIYFSNDSFNNDLYIDRVIDTIKNACEVDKIKSIIDEYGLYDYFEDIEYLH